MDYSSGFIFDPGGLTKWKITKGEFKAGGNPKCLIPTVFQVK